MHIAARITKHIIRIQKTVLNNSFEARALLQEQGERSTRAILDQAVWIPDAGRQLWDCWSNDMRTGCAACQSLMNAQLDMLDGILAPQDTESKPGPRLSGIVRPSQP